MEMTVSAHRDIKLKNMEPIRQGKVRSIYDLGDNFLFVTSDRISAFDHILNQGIPLKGAVLNSISNYWFEKTKNIVKNHVITTKIEDYPEELQADKDMLNMRSMIVKKTKVVPIECVVRGYIEGSGWKEYQQTQTVCGHQLPEGLKRGDKLPEIIFTPATKADSGHDINISIEECKAIIGEDLTNKLQETAIALYKYASAEALKNGIIIADTKFEFGTDENDDLYLIDEILTPDSSRFWDAELYTPGEAQQSYDKQYVRDYLESLNWDKEPPIPDLPDEVVLNTSKKYLEAYKRITGESLV